jgi:stearoyl-CoA desaturase (delta-9 desaturase)
VFCAISLAVPFGLGWMIGGGVGAGLTAMLWAGGVRVCLLHHMTWSINSLCHMVGRRPFTTKDQSRNIGALALLSMGESWHNGHHAFPRSARHGVLAHQWDTSAAVIRGFERAGWASDVHWSAPTLTD